MKKIPFRNLILIWLAWAVLVIGFQSLAVSRFAILFPDRAQQWTLDSTKTANYQKGHPYLLDPFMNNQVAWDSEYYLSIANGDYDDPRVIHLTPSGARVLSADQQVSEAQNEHAYISLNYAFFPMYPWVIRLVSLPLKILALDPIATATLAGIIVSALGTLAGMIALYDLTRDTFDEEGAMRAVFYLLIFPTGFFLIQIYTEGLFVGLAFTCLAMLKRGHWLPAALFGAAATLTRAVGVALVIPMVVTWLRTGEWMNLDMEWRQIYFQGIPWRSLGKGLLAIAPLVTFLIWKFSYWGFAFDAVESNYFGRGVLDLGYAFYAWSDALKSMFLGIPERTAYFLTEFIGLIVGIATCVSCIKRNPEVAWFSLAVLVISVGSGPAQGIQRYILAAPAVFIMLAYWGKNQVFDRAWTILSLLLMALEAMLFAFNFWVA